MLGVDFEASAYAVATLGMPSPVKDLPLPSKISATSSCSTTRDRCCIFTLGKTTSTNVYDIGSGTTSTVPGVAGRTCAHYYPISIDNAGAILGFTSFCTKKSFYFTWDPARGTSDLNLALPASSFSITPLGINDKGQILVSLGTASGATHWGTLDPVSSSPKPPAAGTADHGR